MAVFQTYQASAGNREDLIPIISMISPHDTPVTSSIATKKATGITHDWLSDSLGTPALNAQIEGSDAAFGTITPRVRTSNYIQNIRKTGQISDNQEAVLKAGVTSEYSYQLEKETKNTALDTERAFIQGTRTQGAAATASQMGGLFYYLTTNLTAGSAGLAGAAVAQAGAGDSTMAANATITLAVGDVAANGVVAGSQIYLSGGTGTGQYRTVLGVAGDVVTVGTVAAGAQVTGLNWDVTPDATTTYITYAVPAALTETVLNDSFEACFNQGGSPTSVHAPTKQKRAISGFASSIRRLSANEQSLSNSIDIYESDFGRHAVKTNRWMPAGSLAVLDTKEIAAAYLRPVKAEELARTGASRKFMIESAVTLEVRAENASALILGLA